jgi:hypothetical protein
LATRSWCDPTPTTRYWVAAVAAILAVGCGVTWGVVGTIRAHEYALSFGRQRIS